MSLVVGIDPSLTSAGVAILRDGQPVHVTHHGYDFTGPVTFDARTNRVIFVHNKVAEQIPPDTDLVLIEDLPEHGQIMPSMRDRSALWVLLHATLRKRMNLPVVVINPQTLKVWVTGKGSSRDTARSKYQRQKQDKQLMVSTIESWWPDWKFTSDPSSKDDECEAAALALIGAFHVGDPMPFTPKPRHRLAKIDWSAAPGRVPEIGQMSL